ncbi:hypothetical protein [Oribacterium sp. FC2011]|uniref:hypothetical protein n=1 Tax=Oribacterium sp. FC2011 TaxID=1408311 RepID=UPI0004E1BF6F|nr:hypothetical protein [Oribacterium sp. FC2011]
MSKAFQEPRLLKAYCFFLDILGYTRELETVCTTEHMKQLLDALDAAKGKFSDSSKYSIKFFTDNIIVGVPLRRINELEEQGMLEDEVNSYAQGPAGDVVSEMYADYLNEIIEPVIFYQYTMNKKGFFIRGGLSKGFLYMDDDVVYGNSLIESYHLEDAAVYPRIILSKELKEMVARIMYDKLHLDPFKAIHDQKIDDYPVIPQLLVDEKGDVFVNYLYLAIKDWDSRDVDFDKVRDHKWIIEQKIENSKSLDGHILEKYCWSAYYHNWFCRWFSDNKDSDYQIEHIPIVKENWIIKWIYGDDAFSILFPEDIESGRI